MSSLKRLFSEHPKSVNETYLEHLMFATGFGLRMLIGGLACVVHGLLPFLFKRTGSQCVCELHAQLNVSGRPLSDVPVQTGRATLS
ncbi:MAG: DUF6356 family protein [Rhodospirillaceae bacterium]|nr:DUF6356 family protein [Rhodospirillaceae bacterium]